METRSSLAVWGVAPVRRYALAWHVTLYMGAQSLVYYAGLSWLPRMLRDRGESAAGAGDLLALMGVGNLAVSLVVPVLAQRMRSQLPLMFPSLAASAAVGPQPAWSPASLLPDAAARPAWRGSSSVWPALQARQAWSRPWCQRRRPCRSRLCARGR